MRLSSSIVASENRRAKCSHERVVFGDVAKEADVDRVKKSVGYPSVLSEGS